MFACLCLVRVRACFSLTQHKKNRLWIYIQRGHFSDLMLQFLNTKHNHSLSLALKHSLTLTHTGERQKPPLFRPDIATLSLSLSHSLSQALTHSLRHRGKTKTLFSELILQLSLSLSLSFSLSLSHTHTYLHPKIQAFSPTLAQEVCLWVFARAREIEIKFSCVFCLSSALSLCTHTHTHTDTHTHTHTYTHT
jgi:hypothetical protein